MLLDRLEDVFAAALPKVPGWMVSTEACAGIGYAELDDRSGPLCAALAGLGVLAKDLVGRWWTTNLASAMPALFWNLIKGKVPIAYFPGGEPDLIKDDLKRFCLAHGLIEAISVLHRGTRCTAAGKHRQPGSLNVGPAVPMTFKRMNG